MFAYVFFKNANQEIFKSSLGLYLYKKYKWGLSCFKTIFIIKEWDAHNKKCESELVNNVFKTTL